MDISKAIDKAKGAEREVIGDNPNCRPGCAGKQTRATAAPITVQPLTAPTADLAQLWDGWGTALKPAWEPIIVAMKPLDGTFAQNAEEHGVAGLWIDGGRIGTEGGTRKSGPPSYKKSNVLMGGLDGSLNGGGCESIGKGRWPANLILDEEAGTLLDEQTGNLGKSQGGRAGHTAAYQGGFKQEYYGDMKPGFGDSGGASRFFKSIRGDSKCTDASIVIKNLNLQNEVEDSVLSLVAIEDSQEDKQLSDLIQPFMLAIRIVLKENSDKNTEQIQTIGQKCVQELKRISMEQLNSNHVNNVEIQRRINTMTTIQNLLNINGFVEVVISNSMLYNMVLGGPAFRFRYCAKASRKERGEGNIHSTVKPLTLMEYLCKLTKTPTGGIVLDPFGGSGTTGVACIRTKRQFILIEKEEPYCEIARQRIAHERPIPQRPRRT